MRQCSDPYNSPCFNFTFIVTSSMAEVLCKLFRCNYQRDVIMFAFLSRVVGVHIIAFFSKYCIAKLTENTLCEECDLVDTNTPLNEAK